MIQLAFPFIADADALADHPPEPRPSAYRRRLARVAARAYRLGQMRAVSGKRKTENVAPAQQVSAGAYFSSKRARRPLHHRARLAPPPCRKRR